MLREGGRNKQYGQGAPLVWGDGSDENILGVWRGNTVSGGGQEHPSCVGVGGAGHT